MIIKKIKSLSGESLAEALITFLIAVVSTIILMTTLMTSTKIIKDSDAKDETLYNEEETIETFLSSGGNVQSITGTELKLTFNGKGTGLKTVYDYKTPEYEFYAFKPVKSIVFKDLAITKDNLEDVSNFKAGLGDGILISFQSVLETSEATYNVTSIGYDAFDALTYEKSGHHYAIEIPTTITSVSEHALLNAVHNANASYLMYNGTKYTYSSLDKFKSDFVKNGGTINS